MLTLNTDRSAASVISSRVRFTNSPHRRKEWKPKVSAAKTILLSSGDWRCRVLIRWHSRSKWALKLAVRCVRYLAGGSYPALAETVLILLRSWLERH